MWSKTVFRVIPEIEENPQMPVCQGVPVFWLLPVGWMPIRSQTRRDTNFAIPGYSISAIISRRGRKSKIFLSVVIYVVKPTFVPLSAIVENPANAGVKRLCGVSPCPVPDTATALPKQARYQLRYTPIFLFCFFLKIFPALSARHTASTSRSRHLCYFNISGWVCQAGDWAGNCGCSMCTYAYAKKNTTALAHAWAVVFFGG